MIKKQKLLNKGNFVLFIDSTSTKVSLDASCTASCPLVFRLSPGNFHDTPEGRKLIESIYSKNNSYFLVDRAYEGDRTIALARAHGFHAAVPPKKNHKSPWLYDKQLYK